MASASHRLYHKTTHADLASFKIDQNGVLSFRTSPNYEAPADDGPDNEYRVTVQASDGNQIGYFKVTVNVTDREETGKVTWSVTPTGGSPISGLRQFQPGASLAASVTDPDAVTDDVTGGAISTNITWKWYRGSSVIADAIDASYIVLDSDVGNTIRVMATYSDDSSGPEESVNLTSALVQEASQSNADPAFASMTVSRRIRENSTGNIGGPVAATDADGDTLTYVITSGEDETSFRIDPATGQLMVGPDLMIDFEDTANTDYTVVVTAYDSSGADTDPAATVTINVVNEDEKPTFDDVDSEANVMRAMVDEDVAEEGLNVATYTATDPEGESVSLSLMGDDAGLFELAADTVPGNGASQVLSFKKSPDFEMPGDRNDDNLYEVTVRASDGTMSADRMVVVKVTNVVENGKVALSPEDAVLGIELTATLTDPEGSVSASGQIASQKWTWHNGETTADFTATVDNDIDNATSPTYTPVSDDVGDYLRAMVTYTYQFGGSKTGVSDAVLVQTSRENQAPRFKEGARTFRVVAEDVAALTTDDSTADADDSEDDNIGMRVEATDANDDMVTYTLSGADASLFRIRSNGQLEVKGKLDHETDSSHTVTVMANDGSGGSNATDSITVTIYVTDADEKPVIMVVTTENQAPVFRSSSTTRSIPEGQSSDRAIGSAVAATDPGDSLTYTLEGTDAASFSIHSRTGQLRTSDPLDQGTKSTYTVTVRATDRDGLSDTITVTITVTEAEEQMGEVTLWASATVALTMAPQVGDTITGAVIDPDVPVNVTAWRWTRTTTPDVMASWMDIDGATEAAYMVAADDTGYYLRVMATYTDAVGTDTAMVYSMSTMMVGAEAVEMTLLERYDANDNDEIDLDEVFKAIDDYFDFDDRLTLAEIYELVDLYFES